MKRACFRRVVLLLGTVTLLLGVVSGPAAGETKSRGLQKILGKGTFSEADQPQVERAWRAALHAGIDERDVVSLVETCSDGGFEPAQILRVLSLATQLTLEHLPLESFDAKISEGVAKRVAADKVLQVAERRALMLNRAKAVLNGVVLEGSLGSAREELLPDVAEALEAGRTTDEIHRILTSAFQEGAGVGEIRQKLFP